MKQQKAEKPPDNFLFRPISRRNLLFGILLCFGIILLLAWASIFTFTRGLLAGTAVTLLFLPFIFDCIMGIGEAFRNYRRLAIAFQPDRIVLTEKSGEIKIPANDILYIEKILTTAPRKSWLRIHHFNFGCIDGAHKVPVTFQDAGITQFEKRLRCFLKENRLPRGMIRSFQNPGLFSPRYLKWVLRRRKIRRTALENSSRR